MNPVSHFLASWTLSESLRLPPRAQAAVVWVGLAPDLDGLGAVADVTMSWATGTSPGWYARYHHVLLHGLPGAVLLSVVAALCAGRARVKTFWAAFACVHLHLLCDLVGSGGPGPDDIWPVHYLGPFSETLTLAWSGQWNLRSWQNALIFAGLFALMLHRAVTRGRAPSSLFGTRAHVAFVDTLRDWWTRLSR